MKREQVTNDPLVMDQALHASGYTQSHRVGSDKDPGGDFDHAVAPNSPADPLQSQTDLFLAGCRPPLLVQDIPSNLSGLYTLKEICAWQAAADLSGKLLFEEESTMEGDLSKISCIRFEALFRMKKYDDLIVEVGNILNAEEKRMEAERSALGGDAHAAQPNYNLTISMRLLLYEMKMMTGRSQEALEKLFVLRESLAESLQSTQSNEEDNSSNNNSNKTLISFWLWQVRCHIVNAFIRQRNWKAAAVDLQHMLVELGHLIQEAESSGATEEAASMTKAKVLLLLKLSRVLLQIGSVKLSTPCFEQASALFAHEAAADTAGVSVRDSQMQSQLMLTQGLLLFCTEQYSQALDVFSTVIEAEGSEQLDAVDAGSFFASTHTQMRCVNISTIFSRGISSSVAICSVLAAFDDFQQPLLVAATNNAAVCALYVKRVEHAVGILEKIVKRDPPRHMIDPIVFNLCTLYDLSYSADISTLKKKVLQRVASNYQIDDAILHWRSFRLS